MMEYLSSETDGELGEMMMNNYGSSTFGGFMDLLGFQNLNNTPPNFSSSSLPKYSILDNHNHNHEDYQGTNQGRILELEAAARDRYPIKDRAFINNYQQQPMTPNCSTVSSESGETVHDDQQNKAQLDPETPDEQQPHHPNKITKHELKVKKSNDMKNTKGRQQQNKEARVAFMTRSDVDHLEDGFRWRKYGQKAVKNSTFPRSYYRCTNATCNVKKRVERSLNDPAVVVTTYEGKHTHPSPTLMHHHHPSPATFTATGFDPPQQISLPHNHLQYYYSSFGKSPPLDHGLLQDIVPSLVKKE